MYPPAMTGTMTEEIKPMRVHASEDDKPGQDGQHDADNHWPQAAVKVREIVLDCGRNVVESAGH